MTRLTKSLRAASIVFALAVISAVGSIQINAQSQALNGQIEGVVTDPASAAVPNSTVTVKNVNTGTERTATTDDSGIYRLPLLPLGKYEVTIEAPNFKRLVRQGITLTAGQIATVNVVLEAGEV
ncbi:MAG: carboxypeptidase-like regulatory domain-containing protein [Aridibacter sp.]